jgi:hypothetical protein
LRRSPERYGSPQWQIEALRRLEIPDDMQKKYGFAPLGDANSTLKQQIFAGNATRFYKIKLKAADNTKMPGSPRGAQERVRAGSQRALEPALRLRSRSFD